MECAQINISGGSGSASPETYSIPGIYKVRSRYIHLRSPTHYSMTRH